MTSEEAAPQRQKKSNWLIRLWPVALILIALAVAYMSGLHHYLSLETLERKHQYLKAYVEANLLLTFAIFMVVYTLVTVTMLPGAGIVTIAGGLMFGLVGGSAATAIGATVGASLLFFAAQTSVGKPLRERAGPFVKKIEAGFRDDALSYMFFMRLMPVVPFPVANIAPAILGARPRDFIFTTFIGILPGVIAYTWIGAGLGGVFDRGEDLDLNAFAGQLGPPLIALALVSLIPVIWKRVRKPKDTKL